MKTATTAATDVDSYIAGFPPATRKLLKQFRALIKKLVPDAEELISYNMPSYKYHGILVYFAGYEKHIGFYPMPSAIEAFKKDIAGYKNAKGSVQFPITEPLPVQLISDMVEFRKEENLANAAARVKKKK